MHSVIMQSVLLLLLSCVFRTVVAGCRSSDCVGCTRSYGWFGQCRWCTRDNECHNKGSFRTPCSRAQNIVDESHCNDKVSRYDTELSYKMGCRSSDCVGCIRSYGWFGQCRWCTRDNKCHNKVSFRTPCSRAENIVDKSHCNGRSRYDTELSYKMLLLSSAAYDPVDPQECLHNALPSSNFVIEMVVTVDDCDMVDNQCSGYVAVSRTDKAIAIAFRGSNDIGQILAVFIEGIKNPKVPFLGGKVQTYWKRAFDVLWQRMEPKVKTLRSTYPRYQIWVTGHSLGGTIASLASTWIVYKNIAPRKDIISYTFGMPRVGDYNYALQHDQLLNNSWRVVNFDDLVPHFPTIASLAIVGGPYHHGVEAYYTVPATSVNSNHKECHGRPFNEDKRCSLTTFPYSIERHSNYFGLRVGKFWKNRCVRSTVKLYGEE